MEIQIGILSYWTENIGDWYQTASVLYLWWCYFKKIGTFKEFLNNAITNSKINNYSICWIYRDKISEIPKPKNCDYVILVCSGWFIWKQNNRFHLPPPSWIKPIYTSFHINDPELLKDTLVTDNLRLHQPIGCRDMSTVSLLREYNIEAYFSGCLTMTFNLRDSNLGFTVSENFIDINVFVDWDTKNECNKTQSIKYSCEKANINISVQNMYNYMFANNVTTSRLHVWLPLFCNNANTTIINTYTRKEFVVGDKDFNKMNRFSGIIQICRGNKEDLEQFKLVLFNDTLLKIERSFKYMDSQVTDILQAHIRMQTQPTKYYIQPWNGTYPYQYVRDRNGKIVDNVLLVLAPVLEKEKSVFWDAKKAGKICIGIMSCWTWPYYNIEAAKTSHLCKYISSSYLNDIVNSIDGWLICERNSIFSKSILFSESDVNSLSTTIGIKPLRERDIDIVYCGGPNNDNYHKICKNTPLAIDCLKAIKCLDSTKIYKTFFVGQTSDSDITDKCEYMKNGDWLSLLGNCKILLVSAIYDASPRIITDALSRGCAVIINEQIFGGWKYVVPETGEYFTDVDTCILAFNKIIDKIHNDIDFNPSVWYSKYFGREKSAERLGTFVNLIKKDKEIIEQTIDGKEYHIKCIQKTWTDTIKINSIEYIRNDTSCSGIYYLYENNLHLLWYNYNKETFINNDINAIHKCILSEEDKEKLNNNFLIDISNRINKVYTTNKYDIYVINLKDRDDKKTTFLNNIKNYESLFNLHFYDAYKHKKGWYGCGMSHIAIIKYAKTNNLPYVIVCEDDNKFVAEIDTVKEILDWLVDNLDKWVIFNGNPSLHDKLNYKEYICKYKSENNKLFYSSWGQMTNFIVYNSSCYDTILKYSFNEHIDQYI